MMDHPFFSAARAAPRRIPVKTIWCRSQTPYQSAETHAARQDSELKLSDFK